MARKALLIFSTALILAGAWSWTRPRRPNVLLLTLDAVRPDFLSCYGGTHAPTPSIDALAAGGVVFTQAVCDVPWTRGSVASLMTGRYPTAHGVRTHYDRLPIGVPTMADAFRAAGYRTGAIVANFNLDHIFQLDQGFDTYDDRFDSPLLGSATRPLHLTSIFYGDWTQDRRLRRWKLYSDSVRDDAQTTDAAIGWLRHVGTHPFFLWVHYFAAHERWPRRGDLAGMIGQYQPGVVSADKEVGRLLQALAQLNLDRDTLVVLHADHGQGLLEHGGFGHGAELYEQSVHIPLIMRWPRKLPAGKRIPALIRIVDVFPTVTALAGLDPPPLTDGRSVLGAVSGKGGGTADAFLETYAAAKAGSSMTVAGPEGKTLRFGYIRRGLLRDGWKFIRSEPSRLADMPSSPEPSEQIQHAMTREELYDLEHDPDERTNLIDRERGKADELRQGLAQHLTTGKP